MDPKATTQPGFPAKRFTSGQYEMTTTRSHSCATVALLAFAVLTMAGCGRQPNEPNAAPAVTTVPTTEPSVSRPEPKVVRVTTRQELTSLPFTLDVLKPEMAVPLSIQGFVKILTSDPSIAAWFVEDASLELAQVQLGLATNTATDETPFPAYVVVGGLATCHPSGPPSQRRGPFPCGSWSWLTLRAERS